jgi:hypothetical protein
MKDDVTIPKPVEQDALAAPFSVSVLTATNGNASKQLIVGAQGLPTKGSGRLGITEGRIQQVQLAGLAELSRLLQSIQPNQALVHGVVKGSQPGDDFQLTTIANMQNAPQGSVTRSLEHINWPGGLHLLMWDRDPSESDPTQLSTADELIDHLALVIPAVATAGRLVTTSTTSGIRAKDTKEWLIPPTGMHVYHLVRGDVKRFIGLLTVRLWNVGKGYCILGSENKNNGISALLLRNLVDMAVFSPERLDYVAGARIKKSAPFYQDRGAPVLVPGHILDLDAFPDVTDAEQEEANARQREAKERLAGERGRRVRAVVVRENPDMAAAAQEALVRERLTQSDRGWLPPGYLLYFAHKKDPVAVEKLSSAYDDHRLADPVEPTYRDGTDAVFHWRKGDWRIVSFAHGVQRVFQLQVKCEAPNDTQTWRRKEATLWRDRAKRPQQWIRTSVQPEEVPAWH